MMKDAAAVVQMSAATLTKMPSQQATAIGQLFTK
jgi:hypothetical protein